MLWNDLKLTEPFESASYNQWIVENRQLSLLLSNAAELGKLSARMDAYEMTEDLKNMLSSADTQCWHIWADYVHLTNNRLGITNEDEAFLAYLIKRSLELI